MYRPQEIAHRHFALKNETVAGLSTLERDVIRLDERIKHSLSSSPIRTTLLRADALSALNIDKVYPDIYTVMRLEAAGYLLNKAEDTDAMLKEVLAEENHPTMDLSLLVYRTMQAIQWITKSGNEAKTTSPNDMLALYGRSLEGPHYSEIKPAFRSEPFVVDARNQTQIAYEPPDPDELISLLDDFCDFLNQDTLSPLAQASIVQFQFEALRPFDENSDRTERLRMHYVLHRRGFLENIILPINLFSAHFKNRFYDLLKPHYEKTDEEQKNTILYAEDLILSTTQVTHELLKFTLTLHKTIVSLVESWKRRIGRVQRGSTIELLLYELVGTPIMTITQGSDLAQRSFSATSDAFARLEHAGIVRAGNPIRRNMTFEAPDAMMLHDVMYKKRAVTFNEFVEEKGNTKNIIKAV